MEPHPPRPPPLCLPGFPALSCLILNGNSIPSTGLGCLRESRLGPTADSTQKGGLPHHISTDTHICKYIQTHRDLLRDIHKLRVSHPDASIHRKIRGIIITNIFYCMVLATLQRSTSLTLTAVFILVLSPVHT